jgi:hypothetical protein
MNLKECTLLHIGDIHFKDIDKEERPVDLKDQQFPQKLGRILSPGICDTILKCLFKEIEKSPQAILISGDLTSHGCMKFYKECLSFFKSRIPPRFFEKSPYQRLFIVPGNHDVDKAKFSEYSLDPKFQPMIKALKDQGFPEIPFPRIKTEELSVDSFGKVLIVAINSCMGCGEKRYLPEGIKNKLFELLEESEKEYEKVEEEVRSVWYENIDTPIFMTEDIDAAVDLIQSAEETCMPVILAHHNLLPQRRPRVAMYTELINSGYMREKLLKSNRPIIYLHGHIHDNPIEIIHSSKYEKARLICISAPLLVPNKIYKKEKVGFNIIRILYGHHNIPIGCEITLYTIFNDDVDIRKDRIPFWNLPNSKVLADEKERKILEYVPGNEIYFGELLSKLEEEGEFFNVKKSGGHANELEQEGESSRIKELEEYINALSWLGLVEYEKRDECIVMRTVKRLVI